MSWFALPAAKAAVPALINLGKFLAVCAAVTMLAYAIKGVYDDQVAIRERVITEATAKVAAETRATALTVTVEAQQRRAVALAEELKLARQAVQQLNTEFSDIKRGQQALLTRVSAIDKDLQTKPATEVAAQADAVMAEINAKLEETYP